MPRRQANTHDPHASYDKYKTAIRKAETSLAAANREIKDGNTVYAINQAMNVAYWLGQVEVERSYMTRRAETARQEVERKALDERFAKTESAALELASRIGALR